MTLICIFFKYHLEELKEGIAKNWNKILIGKTPVVRNAIYFFLSKGFFLVFQVLKKGPNKYEWNFTSKVENLFLIINF